MPIISSAISLLNSDNTLNLQVISDRKGNDRSRCLPKPFLNISCRVVHLDSQMPIDLITELWVSTLHTVALHALHLILFHHYLILLDAPLRNAWTNKRHANAQSSLKEGSGLVRNGVNVIPSYRTRLLVLRGGGCRRGWTMMDSLWFSSEWVRLETIWDPDRSYPFTSRYRRARCGCRRCRRWCNFDMR